MKFSEIVFLRRKKQESRIVALKYRINIINHSVCMYLSACVPGSIINEPYVNLLVLYADCRYFLLNYLIICCYNRIIHSLRAALSVCPMYHMLQTVEITPSPNTLSLQLYVFPIVIVNGL